MMRARGTRAPRPALALLAVAVLAWVAGAALGCGFAGAGGDAEKDVLVGAGAEAGDAAGGAEADGAEAGDVAPDGAVPAESELAYLWVRVTARDEDARTVEVEVVDGDVGSHRRGEVPVGATGTLDCSELLTGTLAIRPGTTWVVSYVDEGQTELPVTLCSAETPEHFSGEE